MPDLVGAHDDLRIGAPQAKQQRVGERPLLEGADLDHVVPLAAAEREPCAAPPGPCPGPTMPMASAAASERSRMRLLRNGPRSLIRTCVAGPLSRLCTSTRVPNGSVRCAAVKRVHVVELAGGGRPAVEAGAVPGGDAALGVDARGPAVARSRSRRRAAARRRADERRRSRGRRRRSGRAVSSRRIGAARSSS